MERKGNGKIGKSERDNCSDTDRCLRAPIEKAPHLIQLQAAVPQTLMIIQSSLPYDVISTFCRPCTGLTPVRCTL